MVTIQFYKFNDIFSISIMLYRAGFCAISNGRTGIQVNQVGTVTEAIEVVKLAKDANWGVVISQTSGETEDSFIADLSVGLATGQIKAGAPCRGERLAKYNQVYILHISSLICNLDISKSESCEGVILLGWSIDILHALYGIPVSYVFKI